MASGASGASGAAADRDGTGRGAGGGRGEGLRVVVVGATGNVGTAVVRALVDDPRVGSITGVARRVPTWSPPRTSWMGADLGAGAASGVGARLVECFRGADAVVHLAWRFQPTRDPVATWRANVLGSIRVFAAVARARVPALVHASSVGTYSPGPPDLLVDEFWPTHGWPDAAYSREKAYLERVLDAYESRHRQVRVVRMRPCFLFQPEAATAQWRLFAGLPPPRRLVRPALVPFFPDLPGLRFQALHTADAAEAYRLAVVRPVRGAFNLAADPVLDTRAVAEALGARPVRVPGGAVRSALAAAWWLRLVPASPQLYDLVRRLPLMDAGRAARELGWHPRRTSKEAVGGFLRGLAEGTDLPTPPLAR
ncbi:NAD-dependent epimerase/dehydratase family protein [Streptomyces sp. URMC 123]|uniref:NAD-dependent epimerase/dehydratase family protein n=1 Tax=Streptomyces sp. URMC 123 TaxID=3423403 RepID=UPI003F1DC977